MEDKEVEGNQKMEEEQRIEGKQSVEKEHKLKVQAEQMMNKAEELQI